MKHHKKYYYPKKKHYYRKKQNKQTIIIIVVILLASIVYAYDVGGIGTSIDNVFSELNNRGSSCEERLPNYFLSSDFVNNMGSSIVRSGSEEGENINYHYLKSVKVHKKEIIDDNGNILGTNSIVYSPILKQKEITFEEELEKLYAVEGIQIVDEKMTYKLSWDGLSEDVKQLIGENELKIKVSKSTKGLYYIVQNTELKVFCDDILSNEKGDYSCEIDETYFDTQPSMHVTALGRIAKVDLGKELSVEITPDIFRNKLYEVVDYRIESCKIVG